MCQGYMGVVIWVDSMSGLSLSWSMSFQRSGVNGELGKGNAVCHDDAFVVILMKNGMHWRSDM